MKRIYLFGFILFLLVASTSAYYNMYSGDEFLEVVVNNNSIGDDFVYDNDNIIYLNSSEYYSLEYYSDGDKDYYKYKGKIFDEEKVVRCYSEVPEDKLFYIKCPND